MFGYWAISWHEIGVYDLGKQWKKISKFSATQSWSSYFTDFFLAAAYIDFILEQTNQTQLIYTGYSQGGTSMFVLLSEHPEYNEKLASIHLLAPAVFYTKTNALIQPLLKNINTVKVGQMRCAIQIRLKCNLDILMSHLILFHFVSFGWGFASASTRTNWILWNKQSQQSCSVCEIFRTTLHNTSATWYLPLYDWRIFWTICTEQLLRCNVHSYIHLFVSFVNFILYFYWQRLLLDYSSIDPCGASYMQFIHFGQIFRAGKYLFVSITAFV